MNVARLVNDLWNRVEILDGEMEPFPGIPCVPMPGHTPGHQGIYVATQSETAIIGVDAAMNVAVYAQATITAGGSVSSSLTISATAPQTAGMPWFRAYAGLLLFPVSLLCLCRIRRGGRGIQALACILLLSVISIGCMMGCGGGKVINQQPALPILVNASSDSITKSIPLTLNIQ